MQVDQAGPADDLVRRYLPDARHLEELLGERGLRLHHGREPVDLLAEYRVDVAHAEGDVLLRELVEVSALRDDVADQPVVVLAGALLVGHVGLAEEQLGPLDAPLEAGALHVLYGHELRAVVGQDDGEELLERIGPEPLLKVVKGLDHALGALRGEEDGDLEADVGPVEREQRLAGAPRPFHAVHLDHADVVMLLHVGEVVGPHPAHLPDGGHLLVLHLALLPGAELDLDAQVDVPGVELARVDEPVKGRGAHGELRSERLYDVVHGIAVLDHRRHHVIDVCDLLGGEVEAGVARVAHIDRLFLGLARFVEELLLVTEAPFGTAIADVGRLLDDGAYGLDVILAELLADARAVAAGLLALHVAAHVLALALVLVGTVVVKGALDVGVELDLPADGCGIALQVDGYLGDGHPGVEAFLDEYPLIEGEALPLPGIVLVGY